MTPLVRLLCDMFYRKDIQRKLKAIFSNFFFLILLFILLSPVGLSVEKNESPSRSAVSTVEYDTNGDQGEYFRFEHGAMATTFAITFYTENKGTPPDDFGRLAQEAFDLIDDIEGRMSRYRPDSEITFINHRAVQEPVRLSADLLELVTTVQVIYKDTQGAFDPTVGPLLKLWGFYQKDGILPDRHTIEETLACVGFDKVQISPKERTVFFTREGMQLDLGGIAKGYAVDQVVALLRRYGIKTAAVDAGTSSIFVLGAPMGKMGWRVRLRHPYDPARFVAEVTLKDVSFSASGLGERYVEIDGKRYGHIFDPRTGFPVEGFASTVAIAPSATVSDALSTAFFVMGMENVIQYTRNHPDVRAILVPRSDSGDCEAVWINFSKSEDQP